MPYLSPAASVCKMASVVSYVGLVLCLFAASNGQYVYEEPLLYGTFPSDFRWGVATSAYQVSSFQLQKWTLVLSDSSLKIEGGYNADGKGQSIWDTFCQVNGNIVDGTDGTVACDSYNKYEEDARMIRDMGFTNYRFSISWTRILPNGVGAENAAGIQYYKKLIAALKANGITPVATLYHWDLPQALQDQGGWLNPDVALWFEEYARVCFREFGDDVSVDTFH